MKTSRLSEYSDLHDLAQDLNDSVDDGNKNKNATIKHLLCPRIIMLFFSVPVQALLDTGSQITAISEEFAKYLSLHGKLDELLVSNIVIYTAIGRKDTTIKKQVN